jgi:hypothetical protein
LEAVDSSSPTWEALESLKYTKAIVRFHRRVMSGAVPHMFHCMLTTVGFSSQTVSRGSARRWGRPDARSRAGLDARHVRRE